MLIKLDEHYSRYTNGFAEHTIPANTVREGMRELLNRYPQLNVHLMETDYEICTRSALFLNDEVMTSTAQLDEVVPAEAVVELEACIPTGESSVVKAIVGVVLIVVGVVIGALASWSGWGSMLAYAMINVGISLLVSAVMETFFTPTAPSMGSGSLADSATYTFNGIKNTTAIGTPLSVVYGQHRVGGHWLSIYLTDEETVETINNSEVRLSHNYFYGQLGLCEGEVEAVGDVRINNYPLSFYSDVVTAPQTDFYRVGQAAQTPMPLFTNVLNTTTIGRKVLNASEVLNDLPVVYASSEPMYGYIGSNWKKASGKHIGLYTPQPYYVD